MADPVTTPRGDTLDVFVEMKPRDQDELMTAPDLAAMQRITIPEMASISRRPDFPRPLRTYGGGRIPHYSKLAVLKFFDEKLDWQAKLNKVAPAPVRTPPQLDDEQAIADYQLSSEAEPEAFPRQAAARAFLNLDKLPIQLSGAVAHIVAVLRHENRLVIIDDTAPLVKAIADVVAACEETNALTTTKQAERDAIAKVLGCIKKNKHCAAEWTQKELRKIIPETLLIFGLCGEQA
jgi:hypothetical protein